MTRNSQQCTPHILLATFGCRANSLLFSCRQHGFAFRILSTFANVQCNDHLAFCNHDDNYSCILKTFTIRRVDKFAFLRFTICRTAANVGTFKFETDRIDRKVFQRWRSEEMSTDGKYRPVSILSKWNVRLTLISRLRINSQQKCASLKKMHVREP